MTLPLFKDHRYTASEPASRPPTGHAGLWFDKFCNQWCRDSSKDGLEAWSLKSFTKGHGKDKTAVNPKLEWIRTVTGTIIGDKSLLLEYGKRLSSLARSRKGEWHHFKTAGRFATGLGREHPIENGFVWHPTLGVPYLPGSSVKGLVRAWATSWSEKSKDHVEKLTRIFGPRDQPNTHAQTGNVIFFDALPTKPVQLAADVMTPHYGPYYESKKDDKGRLVPPADWHSPVPIPFLTVTDGQSFVFALAPRTPSDQADCKKAANWLSEALLELGGGAKTAVGYGRFERDAVTEAEENAAKERTAQAAREAEAKAAFDARLANLSPLARELEQAARDQRWEGDANAFKAPGIVENWLARLEADPQRDAIARLSGLLDRHFPGLLANPDLLGGKKRDTPAFKDRWRNLAKQMNSLPIEPRQES